MNASVANYHHKDHPEFEDWGDANLIADNGATNYIRIDWLNPDGLRTWGDGRSFIRYRHRKMRKDLLRRYGIRLHRIREERPS